MKQKIEDQLKDEMDSGDEINFGYYEGRYGTKRWIIESEDIPCMYSKFETSEIHLWCNIIKDETTTNKKKGTTRQTIEEKVENVFTELSTRHQDHHYTAPQLKLWARMIVNGIHESHESPPDVPMITGAIKIPKKESWPEVIASAAAAFTNAMKPTPPSANVSSSSKSNSDVRMKNLEQLRYLQQLHLDNILTREEFEEHKGLILNTLRTL